ncbi:hypothetical protein [Desulfobacter sp.]|uniref:hypothetical protein n=1 Tax=Desulfobacter sp. TaxID=2294 RepID=UPI003D0EB05C
MIVTITETGQTIDLAGAESFVEAMDENNVYSLATGNPDDHEKLFRTPGGRWIVNAWTGMQRPTKWREIDHETALAWLALNGIKPSETIHGSGPSKKVYTRTWDESPQQFQKRVNQAVI